MSLTKIQKNLNCPKRQYNKFGKFNFRSVEDIMESVKPLLTDGQYVKCPTEIICIGGRHYVQATAIFFDGEREHTCTAQARESDEKKGMDSAQVTGAAISYARKYALAGLFLCDDVNDADCDDNTSQVHKNEIKPDAEIIKTVGVFEGADCHGDFLVITINGDKIGTKDQSLIGACSCIVPKTNVAVGYKIVGGKKYLQYISEAA